jgi:hypothetical protein
MIQFIVEPFNVVYRGKEDCHKAIKLSTIFLLSYDSFAMMRFSRNHERARRMESHKNTVYRMTKPDYHSEVGEMILSLFAEILTIRLLYAF